MIDPEISYLLWKFEQGRRDRQLERKRARVEALEPQPLPDLEDDQSEEPLECDLEVAS